MGNGFNPADVNVLRHEMANFYRSDPTTLIRNLAFKDGHRGRGSRKLISAPFKLAAPSHHLKRSRPRGNSLKLSRRNKAKSRLARSGLCTYYSTSAAFLILLLNIVSTGPDEVALYRT